MSLQAHEPVPASALEPFSQNGVLNVTFNYFTTVDSVGRTLFCFTTPNGLEEPTLHVLPGDTLNISVTNSMTRARTRSNRSHVGAFGR